MVATATHETPAIVTAACLTDATITARKLRALAVIGYSCDWLAHVVDVPAAELDRIRSGAITHLDTTVAARLGQAYDLLHDEPRPGMLTRDERAHAEAQRWAGPDEWVDIDDPADLPDAAYRLADVVIPDSDTIGRHAVMSPEQVDAVRAAYRRAKPGGWDRRAVAKRHGLEPDHVSRAVTGRALPGYTDLRPHCGVKHVQPKAPTRPSGNRAKLTPEAAQAIRDTYLATPPGMWNATRIGEQYGVRRDAVTRIITGRAYGPAPDLTDGGRRTRRNIAPADLTAEQVHAVRRDYLSGLGKHRLAARYGISPTAAWQLIHGVIRPDLGLTDLTTQTRRHHPAASPTGGTNRKEDDAA